MPTDCKPSIRLICKNPSCRRPFALPDRLTPTDPFEDFEDADAFMKAIKAGTLSALFAGKQATTRLPRQAAEVFDREKRPDIAECDHCGCVMRIRESRYIIMMQKVQ